MNEADIVLALDGGAKEEDILIRYGIDFDALDEIMAAHDRARCPVCGYWWTSIEIVDDKCPDCRSDEVELSPREHDAWPALH